MTSGSVVVIVSICTSWTGQSKQCCDIEGRWKRCCVLWNESTKQSLVGTDPNLNGSQLKELHVLSIVSLLIGSGQTETRSPLIQLYFLLNKKKKMPHCSAESCGENVLLTYVINSLRIIRRKQTDV